MRQYKKHSSNYSSRFNPLTPAMKGGNGVWFFVDCMIFCFLFSSTNERYRFNDDENTSWRRFFSDLRNASGCAARRTTAPYAGMRKGWVVQQCPQTSPGGRRLDGRGGVDGRCHGRMKAFLLQNNYWCPENVTGG